MLIACVMENAISYTRRLTVRIHIAEQHPRLQNRPTVRQSQVEGLSSSHNPSQMYEAPHPDDHSAIEVVTRNGERPSRVGQSITRNQDIVPGPSSGCYETVVFASLRDDSVRSTTIDLQHREMGATRALQATGGSVARARSRYCEILIKET
ncbi:hypothetical protein BO71DRAFT_425880 [Aspergillus ellipticus CBS 707.79]|uniref:Uncharacterized protein n=1 Tax=Aspergillus ellipticus CBS 707.79 TaxID=1448320 RepID=A0A319F1S7_9EURO|nr:hypothetical protein BO71DRAFT_425880 [Aspergillus ellipticus CBS 707.79]